ncbi:16S rRNA (guanine(527)-N(7))-methyltransferase RsmG [Rhodoligotrophos ferricapiens]|uniref:16S rRNA (guanine(527)-N(7))-methyltransferase RsmG n=1 Tax=Rhodoligotrophos ferricapiens TaxID=3069264 RepID=UPI00315CFB82
MTEFDSDPEAIAAAFGVSRESVGALAQYVELLIRWNRAINLVANSEPGHIWTRHVADSLQLHAFLNEGQAVIDLGSGAGFPGIPLAIARANRAGTSPVYLVESNRKKAAFLANAVRVTGAIAEVIPRRIEDVGPEDLTPRPAWIVARALAPLPKLLHLAKPFLQTGAKALFLKGQDVESELTAASKSWRINADVYPSVVDRSGRILLISHAERMDETS